MAPRYQEGNSNNEGVVDGNANAAKEVHYIGVRKRKWGRYGAEIRDPTSKKRFWLGTWDTAEEAATEYDKAAKILKHPNAKKNFPSSDSETLAEQQSRRATFDRLIAFKAASSSASTASVAALPLTPAAQKINLRNKIKKKLLARSDIAKSVKPWTQPFLNRGVGVQGVGNDSLGMIRSSMRPEPHLRNPSGNPNPNPSFNPSHSFNFVDNAADLQQPPVVMTLFGRTLWPQIRTHEGHGWVGAAAGKNRLHATSNDDSSQPIPPEMKKVSQQLFDLNLEAEEDYEGSHVAKAF